MSEFKPCLGKNACRDGDSTCITCGRPLDEVAQTRDLIDKLAELVMTAGYDNVEEFTGYVARKVMKKVEYRREKEQG